MGLTLAEKILSEHTDHEVHDSELSIINIDIDLCLTLDGIFLCRTCSGYL